MNPLIEEALLAALRGIPLLFAAIKSAQAAGQLKDPAAIEAARLAALAAMDDKVHTADTALDAAAKTP